MIVSTMPNLVQLQTELASAGIGVSALGTYGEPPEITVHTYDEDGGTIDLPPGAAAVVAAHVPADPPPSEAAGLLEMAGTIDPGGNTAVAELSVIVQAFAAVAAQRGW